MLNRKGLELVRELEELEELRKSRPVIVLNAINILREFYENANDIGDLPDFSKDYIRSKLKELLEWI